MTLGPSSLRALVVAAALALVATACGSGDGGADETSPTSSTALLPTTDAPIVDFEPEAEPEPTTTTEAGPAVYTPDQDPPAPAVVEALDESVYADQFKTFALGGDVIAARGYRSDPGYVQLFRLTEDLAGWEALPIVQLDVGHPTQIDTHAGTLRLAVRGSTSTGDRDGTRTYLSQDLASWLEVGTGFSGEVPDGFDVMSTVLPVPNSPFLLEFGSVIPIEEELGVDRVMIRSGEPGTVVAVLPDGSTRTASVPFPVDSFGQAKQLVRFTGTAFERLPITQQFNAFVGTGEGVLTFDLALTTARLTTDGVDWRDVSVSTRVFQSPAALNRIRAAGSWLYVPEIVEGDLFVHRSDDLGRSWTTQVVTELDGELGSVLVANGSSGVALAVSTASGGVVLFSPTGEEFEVLADVDAIDGDRPSNQGPIRTLAVGSGVIVYSLNEWGVLPIALPLG